MRAPGRALLVAAACLTAPLAARAFDGTVQVTGNVVQETCTTITNNGGTAGGANFTVALPKVSTTTLNASVGATAGRTRFQLLLSNCTFTAAGNVSAFFEGSSAINSNGQLTTAVAGVVIELLNDTGITAMDLSKPWASQQGSTAAVTAGTGASAVLTYYAQYKSTAGGITGGLVSASVNYTIVYP